jgi:hypothetical protein
MGRVNGGLVEPYPLNLTGQCGKRNEKADRCEANRLRKLPGGVPKIGTSTRQLTQPVRLSFHHHPLDL